VSRTNVVLSVPGPRRVELVERPYPRIKPGYAIIETAIAPVCLEGTRIWAHHDFEVLGGPTGQTSDFPDGLGHEGVGTIAEVAPGSSFRPGERVIVFQGDWCGRCHACRNGLSPTYCTYNMAGRPGARSIAFRGLQEWNDSESGGWAMARYRIAAEPHLFPIPDDLDFRYAAAANCSVGAGWSNQELMGVGPGDTVLLAGIGFITMGHAISALHRRARVIALVRNPFRADLLRRMGVEHLVNPEDDDWLEQVRALTYDGQGVDHAVDGSGVPYYQQKVILATRVYGSVNFSGHTPSARLDFSPLEVVTHYARRITGQHDVRMRDREGLIRCLMDPDVQRRIDVMVTHELPMSRAADAFEIQVSKRCGKIYLLTQC
jgi:threonine dehydrogenase-like Zn-dependent dehydrogenase